MKTYDQLLDEVAQEKKFNSFDDLELEVDQGRKSVYWIGTIAREAAERYRAQLELPSDEEIEAYFKEIYPITQNMPSARRLAQLSNRTLEISGAKWMRDHIAKQLKQGI